MPKKSKFCTWAVGGILPPTVWLMIKCQVQWYCTASCLKYSVSYIYLAALNIIFQNFISSALVHILQISWKSTAKFLSFMLFTSKQVNGGHYSWLPQKWPVSSISPNLQGTSTFCLCHWLNAHVICKIRRLLWVIVVSSHLSQW